MMQIRLFSFTKRSNSTGRPATSGWSVDVLLKEETSIMRPSFLLKHDAADPAEVYDYNYVYCQEFQRYYHITNIESVRNDLWRIDCDVDVLASWKTQIQAASAFVAYSTTLGNPQIPDRRLSVVTQKSVSVQYAQFSTLGYCTNSNKAVILTVTGKDRIGHYVISPAVASMLLNSIDTWLDNADVLPVPDPTTITSTLDALKTIMSNFVSAMRQLIATGNAADNITNVVTFPVAYTGISGTTQEILLGNFETGIQATFVPENSASRVLNDYCVIPIPWPSADFRRQNPYTQLILYCPFVGYINISPAQVMGDTAIQVSVDADIFTGDCIFTIRGVTSDATPVYHVIGQYAVNVAAPFAIGRSAQTPLTIGTQLMGAASGAVQAASGNLIGGSEAAISGIIGALETQPTAITSGGGSAFMSMPDRGVCTLYCIFHDTNVNPASVSAVIGRPTMENSAMSIFSGYVETREFSVSGPMTEKERTEINNAMDGGVFIE